MDLEEHSGQPGAYAGLLDNFGSEIGSTLEDLVSHWNDADYDLGQNADDAPSNRPPNTRSLFQYRDSMDGTDDISDWSLKKARPLAFANPVYDLMILGGVVTKTRQMTLIPLDQFDINKQQDGDKGKNDKTKQKKGTLMNKISSFSLRKHSLKKSEPEINVTAPLWTDVPAVLQDPVRRSGSIPSSQVDEKRDSPKKEDPQGEGKPDKPRPQELDLGTGQVTLKAPPQKTPRTAKGSFSPFNLTPDDPNAKTIPDPQSSTLELPDENQTLRPAVSTSSLASDLCEDPVEEGRTTKTMMEVMHEIEDEPADQQNAAEQKPEETETETSTADNEKSGEEAPQLKRNKTLKWSGSRAAPALIREFTRKSKKAAAAGQSKQLDLATTDSPEVSSGESPAKTINDDEEKLVSKETGDNSAKKSHVDRLQAESGKNSSAPCTPKKRDSSAFTILSSLLPPAPKLRRSESTKIRMYIHRMGSNPQNALGYATTEFVKQTLQSTEQRPLVLLHSIRSFLTDMKKYLITNPHVGFMGKIQKIIKNMQIHDVEGAIDDALERLVLYPLRDFIYKRLVIDYAGSGKIKLVEEAIKLGQTKSPQELGIRATLIPPNAEAMETVKHHFMELQTTYSPYYKLKHLLSAVTTIYENTSDLTCEDQSARKIGADDFFPLLVHAIVKCNFTAADIEAQYIDGLLCPTLLLGEGGYYLTSLISAVQLLSSMKKRETPLPNITDLQGFLKVGISSKTEKMMESDGVLMHKTLHVPPSMTAHNLGMMIAKKYGMKSAKNFCLHVVVNGVAYPLKPQEFPQLVKMDLLTQFPPESFFFIYRQLEKSPEKPIERPALIDSKQLKLNTEEGESVLTAEKEEAKSEIPDQSLEANTSDSDSATKPGILTKADSSDEILSSDDVDYQDLASPGFADIPLPSDALLHQASTVHDDKDAAHDISEENAREVPEQSEPSIQSGGDKGIIVQEHEETELPRESAVSSPNPTCDDQLPRPDASLLVQESCDTPLDSEKGVLRASVDSAEKQATSLDENYSLPEEVITASMEETLPPPVATSSPVHDTALTPIDIPPPPDDVDSALDNTLTSGGLQISAEINVLPPPPEDSSQSPIMEDCPPSGSMELSDGECIDDTLTDETYLRATVVDDVLSPVKQRLAAPAKNVQAILEEEEEAETQELAIPVQEPIPHPVENQDVPQLILTDTSSNDQDGRPESSMSDVSIGSTGFHSDGHYGGGGGDGRYSSRGYHSDSHQADDGQGSIGAQSSVAVLKTYFEEEITKVSQHSIRTTSPHSPH